MVKVVEMLLEVVKVKGVVVMFGEKYVDVVWVVDYLGVFMELCGGIYVNNIVEIGVFKIIFEVGIFFGVCCIEVVVGLVVLDYLKVWDIVVKELSDCFKVKFEELLEWVSNL